MLVKSSDAENKNAVFTSQKSQTILEFLNFIQSMHFITYFCQHILIYIHHLLHLTVLFETLGIYSNK